MLTSSFVRLALAGAIAAGLSAAALAATAPGAVSRLVLVNTRTQQDLRVLQAGDTVSLVTDGDALNIRAEVTGSAGSVTFYFDGRKVRSENITPYAFAADDSGVYRKWTPSAGTHTVRAVPTSSTNGSGTAGAEASLTFTVITTAASSSAPSTPSTSTPPPSSGSSLGLTPALLNTLYGATGQLNLSVYGLLALSYDRSSMEARLGPSFLDLAPIAADDRPTLFRPASKANSSGYIRINPYELGSSPVKDSDYWSDAGQVGYVPDAADDPGLDRIQTYAYYDHVFAISPRLDYASGRPHPDQQTRESYYATLFGELPKYPIAMVRNYGMQCNEALVLYRDGNLGVAGTQTSRAGSERPYPGFVLPANKVPTGIAITTANEFAVVTIWDTDTRKGQLAVLALEGKYLPFHTWPYMALPNQGSWSGFKLLGYVDLPMAMPTSVAAASNGWWSGPSQTGGKVLSQIDLANDTYRQLIYSGSWAGTVAMGGYAIVASKYDNTVALVDLTPLFAYVRESYLSSATSFAQTMAARGDGPNNFPQAFSVRPSITPKVVWQTSVTKPTAVLAGMKMDRWTRDYFKAYVASEDGTIRIIDASPLMKRNTWEKLGSLRVVGSFNVGRNPVSMCFARRGDGDLPLLPTVSDGTQARPDPLNNLFYVAVRGDRKVVAAVTFAGQGAVYRTIKDSRLGDPVAVSTAVRGPVVTVADFRGKKLLSFRVGPITDARNGKTYGAGADGQADFELAGELPVAGNPFLVNSTNVN